MSKLLTQYSSHANTIADTFRAAFVKTPLGDCVIDMTAPEESTKGGLLGLQHATLKTPVGMAIVVGVVHAGEKRAELRAYPVVVQAFEERFKMAPPFTAAQYAAFLHRAQPILAAFGLTVTVAHALERGTPLSLPPPAPPRRTPWLLFGVGLLVILAAAGMWIRALVSPGR